MKNSLIIIAFLFISKNVLFAQTDVSTSLSRDLSEIKKQHAENITNAYANLLNLTSEQKEKVYSVIIESFKNPIKDAGNNSSIQSRERVTIHLDLKENFKNILNKAQFIKYKRIHHFPELKETSMKIETSNIRWE